MCGVVPQSWQGGRCAPPLHPPSRGPSKASSLDAPINRIAGLITRGRLAAASPAKEPPCSPAPHGQPCAVWTRRQPSLGLDARSGLSRPERRLGRFRFSSISAPNHTPGRYSRLNNQVAEFGYFGQYIFGLKGLQMKRLSAAEAKNGFGRFMDLARREPVLIEKHNRPVIVAISIEEYDRLTGGAAPDLTAGKTQSGEPSGN